MTIEVRITALELVRCVPALLESLIVSKLRSAGIPVRGLLVFGGVAHGSLAWHDDPVADCRVYRWSGLLPVASLP